MEMKGWAKKKIKEILNPMGEMWISAE